MWEDVSLYENNQILNAQMASYLKRTSFCNALYWKVPEDAVEKHSAPAT